MCVCVCVCVCVCACVRACVKPSTDALDESQRLHTGRYEVRGTGWGIGAWVRMHICVSDHAFVRVNVFLASCACDCRVQRQARPAFHTIHQRWPRLDCVPLVNHPKQNSKPLSKTSCVTHPRPPLHHHLYPHTPPLPPLAECLAMTASVPATCAPFS